VIEMNPTHPPARINRGQVRMAKRDFPGALEDFTDAIRLDPNNIGA
jgi:cytochrome c-type biogenesis protein CcmH/NrfG